jgi:hypothetical protein
MKNKFFMLIIAASFISCSETKTDEVLLELDKKALEQNINYEKITFYKFAKIAIRSSAVKDTLNPEYRLFSQKSQHLLQSLSNVNIDSGQSPSVVDALLMYNDYRSVKKFVKEIDEDIFPLLTEGLSGMYGNKNEVQLLSSKSDKVYFQNLEHAILSMLVLGTRDLGKEFALYECGKTQPELLADSEEKTLLEYVRGLLFFSNKLYYLSEDGISRNIAWLNKNKNIPLPMTKGFFRWGNLSDEQTHTAFLAMNHVFRGFDRLMMEREIDEKRAMEDFEAFLASTQKLGLQNEIIWAIEAFLYLKKEQPEQAIVALTKLQKSPLCGTDEQKTLATTIGYLQDRKPDKALNGVYDKVFIGKIASRYMFSVAAKIDWEHVLKANNIPHTAEFFAALRKFRQISDQVASYGKPDVIEAGKNSLKKEGSDLLNKAKGLLN